MALLDLVRDALHEQVASLGERDAVSVLMADWLGVPVEVAPADLAGQAASRGGAGRSYRDVAALGFALAAGREVNVPFQDGVAWLADREFFVGGRAPTLEADGLAAMGVAVGMAAVGTDDRGWLLDLAEEAGRRSSDEWETGMFAAAGHLLGLAGRQIPPDLAAALAGRGVRHLPDDAEAAARAQIATPDPVPPDRAVVRLAALRWLLRQEAAVDLRRPNVEHLVAMLGNFEHGMKRWPWESKPRTPKSTQQRWDIQNEYHVQSVLWAMLAPVFPGIVDEEYLRKIGPKQPRADLGLPGLRTIIEVKYMRDGEFSRTLGGVAEDTSLYLSGDTGYDRIVAFVWDASAASHRREELRRGLLALNGVEAAIVVARPGPWIVQTAPLGDQEGASVVEETP